MISGYKVQYYDTVETTKVSWLWYPYIPYGKITIVQGDPGEGKTTMMLQIATLLTQGKSVPDGRCEVEPQNVIFQGAEDGHSDTIKPRLESAGADCSRIAFIDVTDGRRLSLSDDRFEDAIREIDAKLLIIDPLQAFLDNETDFTRPGAIRESFARLAKTAEETGCAVVMIGHMNKGSSNKGIYRGLGSIDVAAAARSILLVGRDRDNPYTRIIVPIKTSLAPEGDAYSFELHPEQGFRWIGRCSYTSNEILGTYINRESKLERAKAHLRLLLKDEDMHGAVVHDRMRALGIGRRTVDEARAAIGVESYKKGNIWYWHLKEGE